MHLLFDNIEQDVIEKEKFVVSQSKTIQEMQVGINRLVDYVQVLDFVAQ